MSYKFKLLEIPPFTDKTECKGLFFRANTGAWFESEKQRFNERRTLTLLKKLSCPGCEKCDWFWDAMNTYIYDEGSVEIFFAGLEHGKLYAPHYEADQDWETGIDEGGEITMQEIKET